MKLSQSVIILLLIGWSYGQEAVELVGTGSTNIAGGIVNLNSRRTVGGTNSNVDPTAGVGTDTVVNTRVETSNVGTPGGSAAFNRRSSVVNTGTGGETIVVNNAGGTSGTDSLFVDEKGVITGRTGSEGAAESTAAGTFGGTVGTNTGTVGTTATETRVGTLPGTAETGVNFGNNVGTGVGGTSTFDASAVRTVDRTVNANVVTGTRTNNAGTTNNFNTVPSRNTVVNTRTSSVVSGDGSSGGTVGVNAAVDTRRTVPGSTIVDNNVGVRTESNSVNIGSSVGVNAADRSRDNTGGTSVVNVGATIGGTDRRTGTVTNNARALGAVRTNVRTTQSGGTVTVGKKERLTAVAQNKNPRYHDVSQAECLAGCDVLDIRSKLCIFASATNCQKFVICYQIGLQWFGYSYYCPFGKYWNSYYQACVPSVSHTCDFDRCAIDSQLDTYRDESLEFVDPSLNCRTHWRCQNRRSVPVCCPLGEAYRPGLGCQKDVTCRDSCCPDRQIFIDGIGCKEMPHDICFEKCCGQERLACVADNLCVEDCIRSLNDQVSKDCPYSEVQGRPDLYYVNQPGAGRQEMPCAPGLVFMLEKCTCVQGPGSENVEYQCRPTVHLDFNKGSLKNVNGAYDVDVTRVESVNDFGYFGNRSRAIVPYYRENSGVFYSIYIKLRFHDSNEFTNAGEVKGPKRQVLVSNCNTDARQPLSPSLAIVIEPEQQLLSFVGITEIDKAMFQIPYNRPGWNNVELIFDGTELYGKVENEDVQNQNRLNVIRQRRPLRGHLKPSNVGISIGSCSENDYFIGYLDEIWTFDCLPEFARKEKEDSRYIN